MPYRESCSTSSFRRMWQRLGRTSCTSWQLLLPVLIHPMASHSILLRGDNRADSCYTMSNRGKSTSYHATPATVVAFFYGESGEMVWPRMSFVIFYVRMLQIQ